MTPDPNNTIYTKDAKILANLKVNLEVLILTLRVEMGKHGHAYWTSVALVHSMQQLTELHGVVVKAGEHLSQEVKNNLDLIMSGQINTGEE